MLDERLMLFQIGKLKTLANLNTIIVYILLCIFFILFPAPEIKAQTAKSFYKSGISNQKKGNCKEAINNFNSAINLNPKYTDALKARALCYFNLKNYKEAIVDYDFLYKQDLLNENYIIKLALSYFELNRWADAHNMFLKLEAPEINLHIEEAKVKVAQCKIMLQDYNGAIQYLNENLSAFNENDLMYYYKGIAASNLKEYQAAALSFKKAIDVNDNKLIKKSIKQPLNDSLNAVYYLSLANTLLHMFSYEDAIKTYQKVIQLEPNNADVYLKRAYAYAQINKINEANNDIIQCEKLNLKTPQYYYISALVYKKSGQFYKAIEQLKQVATNDTAFYAFYSLGQSEENIGRLNEAQISYNRAAASNVPDSYEKDMEMALKRIRIKVYEQNRETINPEIDLLSPVLDIDQKAVIPIGNMYIEVKGRVNDQSLIKHISVNGLNADFYTDSLNPEFNQKVILFDKDSIVIKAIDLYSNSTTRSYAIYKTDNQKPQIKIISPVNSEKKNEIYFNTTNVNKVLKLTARVDDQSLIKSIIVNEVTANFKTNEINPMFEVEININHTDSVHIEVTDIYENKLITTYFINSKKVIATNNNPMGKTWVVFIANSNYENFATLTGPETDLNNIREAIQNYQIDNFIALKNMTKNEMERFFRIELRDLIKEQGVSSILIWYAGHGKFLNETGYWLPVTAQKNDELSYYPISYLRSSLTSYGSILNNILIVSDACESGASFSIYDEKITDFSCTDLKMETNRSAYIFSSTSFEKASDNSLFCQSFASLLDANKQYCLPVSKIVRFVTETATSKNQHCRYGKITNMGDNKGSFYFIRK